MWTVVVRLVWGRIVLPHRDGVVWWVFRSLGWVGDKTLVDLCGKERYNVCVVQSLKLLEHPLEDITGQEENARRYSIAYRCTGTIGSEANRYEPLNEQ